MAISFSYWDDCIDPHDLEAMWKVPEVSAELLKAGEVKGRKIHLSRDPDGQPYLTQTEMRVKNSTLVILLSLELLGGWLLLIIDISINTLVNLSKTFFSFM